MTLWLVRHARPLVEPGVCYGALDVAADVAATQAAAGALAAELPRGLTVYASPLQRCEQLTQALRELRPDLTCKTDARLAEMDFGAWEGQRWDAIARAELDAWTDAFASWRCGGGECVQGFMARAAAAWDDMLAQDQPAVWITHAGVIRATTLLAQGQRQISRADQWPVDAPAFGQWRTVELRST
ncbi:MAG: histidine phosphatase family protein [Burkholderiales bacterium]|nr:histidine phosphatase family protein [Burkholderiales bacterium]